MQSSEKTNGLSSYSKKKIEWGTMIAGSNHGRSVQQLAQDSCKLPPGDPVAHAEKSERRNANRNPGPILLACSPFIGEPFPFTPT